MLQVTNLAVAYDGVPALHDVSFRVEAGHIVALVGSNGAGKSTTLRTLSGLLKPVQGTIRFNGQAIERMAPFEIAALGLAHVPEGRRLFTRLSVIENLRLGAYTQADPRQVKQTMDKMFALFPILGQRRHQRAGTLSGGEQQMLAIARALMSQPRLLMLDEPSLGLAPRLVDDIFATLKTINAEGTTILLVEQNVREALEIADWGYVLQTGRTIMSGPATDLLSSDLVRQAYLGL